MDEDEEEGRGQHGMFCLQRFPEDVFGDDDQKMYPITELDPAKVSMVSYLYVGLVLRQTNLWDVLASRA